MSNDDQRQRHPFAIYGTRADFERLRPNLAELAGTISGLSNQRPIVVSSGVKVEAIGVCLGPLGPVVAFERVDLYTFDVRAASDALGGFTTVRMVMPNADSAAAFAAYLEAATRQQ